MATTDTPTPVIRHLATATEEPKDRLLKRQLPAIVVSGAIHVVLVSGFLIYFKLFPEETKATAATADPVVTLIDDPTVKDPILTEPIQGLDPELPTGVADIPKEDKLNILAPPLPDAPPALPGEAALPSDSMLLGDLLKNLAPETGQPLPDSKGPVGSGNPGKGGPLDQPGFGSRASGERRNKLVTDMGGSPETEAAVAAALVWLAKQQHADGYWEFDGNSKADRVAATAMCMLPFLAAGETHRDGKYKFNVAKGLAYLKTQLRPTGRFAQSEMYSQAIGTIALCELAGMTQDDTIKKMAKLAVDYIVKAQARNGSWGYQAGDAGDTSIVGWQIQALKSARLADIAVSDKVFEQAEAFLESVSDSGATYGYRTKGSTHTLTAVGLLCRQYMGWGPKNPTLARGIKYMWDSYKPRDDDWNMYYYYYATQVFHFFDGPAWHKDWNPAMREVLLKKQVTEKSARAKSEDVGSWPKDSGQIGTHCGKLGTTALACLTLEVYYRHLPLYKRTGLEDLERDK
jgi:hypothetical protein